MEKGVPLRIEPAFLPVASRRQVAARLAQALSSATRHLARQLGVDIGGLDTVLLRNVPPLPFPPPPQVPNPGNSPVRLALAPVRGQTRSLD